jgi:hypothetical protein
MLTYQRSKIWSPQSCSQSADPDEGSLLPLPSADHEQLWLTYNVMQPMPVYEVRPRKDQRSVDLISDALPLGRLWYSEPDAVSNAIDYALL